MPTGGGGELSDERQTIAATLTTLVSEAFLHAAPQGGWFLDAGQAGFVDELARISAQQASQAPAPGRKTIASHAAHVNYHLTLLNRFAAGEPNPFATAEWSESWIVDSVSEAAWGDLQGDLKRNAEAWLQFVKQPRAWGETELTGAFASAAHAAYHLGAVRQMIAWVEWRDDR
jgi:hypothetical protein